MYRYLTYPQKRFNGKYFKYSAINIPVEFKNITPSLPYVQCADASKNSKLINNYYKQIVSSNFEPTCVLSF